MRFVLPVTMLLVLVPATAQVPLGSQSPSRERMRADLEFLCSPPLEGRASLTRGADASAWFLAAEMRKAGLANGPGDGIKVLGEGELNRKLTVSAHGFSASAKAKIEAKGGTCEVISKTAAARKA